MARDNAYDAIVVGTGITGGWAAKELTEKGLKTLVLDRGRMVKHGEYPTATKDIWELPYGGRPTDHDLQRQEVAARTGFVITQADVVSAGRVGETEAVGGTATSEREARGWIWNTTGLRGEDSSR